MNPIDPNSFKAHLKSAARRLGFAKAGITHCGVLDGEQEALKPWLQKGGGELFPYRNHPALLHPNALLEGAQSALVVYLPYYRQEAVPGQAPGSLKLSRYLWGPDYHVLIKQKLNTLLEEARHFWPGLQGRACVDTAPLLERALAVRAGLGWQGRNTLLIAGKSGSFGFLGVLLLTAALEPDPPFPRHHCGTCRACLGACPTQALSDFALDPRRCLATYTLEWEGEAPIEVQKALRNTRWAAGCDICQEVCPWNRQATEGEAAWWGTGSLLHTLPAEQLALGTAQYRKQIKNSAMRRVRHRHWLLTLSRILKN